MQDADIQFFDVVEIAVHSITEEGPVLDIGGGGEGVIGRVHRVPVVAIDLDVQELTDAPEGTLKIVMDATDLKFLDGTFPAVTAFFSLMYMQNKAQQRRTMAEALRVLRPGGTFHIWECAVEQSLGSSTLAYAVQLRIVLETGPIEVAYGTEWPRSSRNAAYYRAIAESVGFHHHFTDETRHVFHMVFRKAPS